MSDDFIRQATEMAYRDALSNSSKLRTAAGRMPATAKFLFSLGFAAGGAFAGQTAAAVQEQLAEEKQKLLDETFGPAEKPVESTPERPKAPMPITPDNPLDGS